MPESVLFSHIQAIGPSWKTLPIVKLQTKPFQDSQLLTAIQLGTLEPWPQKFQSKKAGPFFPLVQAGIKLGYFMHFRNFFSWFVLQFFLLEKTGSKILALIKYSCRAFFIEAVAQLTLCCPRLFFRFFLRIRADTRNGIFGI